MIEGIKKINLNKLTEVELTEIRSALKSWHNFTSWIKEQDDEELLLKCCAFEIKNKKRAQWIDRIRTRYNKVCQYRELKALEKHCKMIINLNYLS